MRKLSNKDKEMKGTLRKCRIKNPPAYEKLTNIPDPSFKLNNEGLDYFTKFCQMLIDNKLMTAAYIPIITRASKYYETYKYAVGKVEGGALTQVAESGWEQKGVWWTVMTDAEDRITKIEEKFGMTLMTLQKIDLPKQDDKNPLLEL